MRGRCTTIISVLLAIVLMCPLLILPASAAADKLDLRLTADRETARAGDEVKYTLYISGTAESIRLLRIRLDVPAEIFSDFKLSVTPATGHGGALAGLPDITAAYVKKDGYAIFLADWNDIKSSGGAWQKITSLSGVLATVTATVAASVAEPVPVAGEGAVSVNTGGGNGAALNSYYCGTGIPSRPFSSAPAPVFSGVSVSGKIQYQGGTARVELYDSGDKLVASTDTDTSGEYTFAAVPEGSGYYLKVSKLGFLTYTYKGVTVAGGVALPEVDISTFGGDVNENGGIYANDFQAYLTDFNKDVPAEFNYAASDLNGSGSVYANDFSILLAGFNKTVADAHN